MEDISQGENKEKVSVPEILSLSSDVVIGFVQPVGTDLCSVRRGIREVCNKMGVDTHYINLTELIDSYGKAFESQTKSGSHDYVDIDLKMSKGNELRKNHGSKIFATYALARIFSIREGNIKSEHRVNSPSVYILDSFKHREEVELIRKVYGQTFFLFAISSENRDRVNHLMHHKGMAEIEAHQLMIRDEGESDGHGQQMRKVFQQADIFFKSSTPLDDIQRVMEIIFGNQKLSPTRNELWMYLAAGAAAKSSDPSRQVGAAIVSDAGELLAVGPNEVPKPMGGLYSHEDKNDQRDEIRGYEQNHRMKSVIKDGIVREVENVIKSDIGIDTEDKKNLCEKILKNIRDKIEKIDKVDQLTEYVRAVHGEMEAIISCARKGISTTNSTLYCTTFPCHNCAKHIVNAGIKKVVYIEPYQKSLAIFLHGDAIVSGLDIQQPDKVLLEQFCGIGPRRFLDFFSLNLSSGVVNERKGGKDVAKWEVSCFSPRIDTARFFTHKQIYKSCEYESARWIAENRLLESGDTSDKKIGNKHLLDIIERLKQEELNKAQILLNKLNAEKQSVADGRA